MSEGNLNEPWIKRATQTLTGVTTVEASRMDHLMKEFRGWNPFSNQVFSGHAGPVWSCSMTSDNQIIFSGSEDKTVKVWDANTQELLHTFTDHGATVNALDVVCDDKYLVSGDWNGKMYVWDWKEKTKQMELVGHTAGIYTLSVSKSSKYMVTGGGDYMARVWDLSNFSLLGSCDCENNSVFALALTNNFSDIICGGWGGFIRVFDSKTFARKASFDGKAGVIQSMGLTSNNAYLIIGTRNNKVKIFNYAEKTEYFTFSSHENWVRNLVITNDSKYFITVSADKSIRIFNIPNKTEELNLEGSEGYVFGEYLSKDGQFLLTGASDKLMRLWKLGKPERVSDLTGHEKCIMSLVVTADDKYIVTGSEDKTVRIWSLEEFSELAVLNGHTETVWSVAVSNDSKYIASVSGDKKLILWDFETRTIVAELCKHTSPIFCVTFSHDSKRVFSGAQDKNIIVWSVEEKSDLRVLAGHTDTVFALKVSYDNNFLISGAADYTIRIWDLNTLEQSSKIETKGGMIESISLSSDGKYLALGDRASKVTLWDWNSKTLLKKFHHHIKWVKSVSFSADNNLFVSASNDFTVRVWNASEERQELVLRGHTSTIRAVRFTNNGKYVISAGEDLKIKVWNIADTDPFELADFGSDLESFLYLANIKSRGIPNMANNFYTFGQLRINLIHFYAYLGFDELIIDSLRKGAEIKTDIDGHSPLFYALARNSQSCIDTILKYMNRLKDQDMELYLNYCNAIRDDFENLLGNHSVYLPEFLEELFYTVPSLPNFGIPKSALPMLFFNDLKSINTTNFITESELINNTDEVPIEFKTLPFAIPFHGGSEESLKLLENITNCPNRRILQTRFIKSYIHNKWNNLWKFILFLAILMWVNIALMSVVIVEMYSYSWTVVDSSTYVSLIAFLGVNVILALYELVQAVTTGFTYFYSFWNIIDIFRTILCFVWGFLSMGFSQESLFIITWVMVVLNFFRGLTGFRAFSSTRYYTRLIIRAFNDSAPFLTIFFYSTFAFGVIYFVSKEGSEESIFTLWRSPYELNMGDIGSANSENAATYLYFMMASVINVIIMLNLLISILGDSFDSFQMDALQIDCLEMAELILEIEGLMFWKKSMNEKKYMQTCQITEGEENQEWEGKVKMVLVTVRKMRQEIQDELADIKLKVGTILDKMPK